MQRPGAGLYLSVLEELQGSLYGWSQNGERRQGGVEARRHRSCPGEAWRFIPREGETPETRAEEGRACLLWMLQGGQTVAVSLGV